MSGIIQIAGVKSLAEAQMLLKNGVDLIGYPLRLDVNVEDTTEAEAAEIIAKSSSEKSVLITYLDKTDDIIEFMDFLTVKWVQLHGEISIDELKKLRQLRPDFKIIKSLVIRPDNSDQLEELIHYTYEWVDYYITDTFDPVTGASGATGKTHDWNISRELVEISPKPVIIAGGLNAENVALAIETVMPFGVDAHTGVEDERGDKAPDQIKKFVSQARLAFKKIENSETFNPDISDVLDLHTFNPKEVKSLVPEFLASAVRNDIHTVRIIHGKGSGTLRTIVHSILDYHPLVVHYNCGDLLKANWGATVVELKS